MIYLQDNPLLKQPLKPKHIKSRLLGHWGSSPGLAFIYIHLNRLIKKYDLNTIFMAGPDMERQVSWGQSALKGLTLKVPGQERRRRRHACILQAVLVPRGIGATVRRKRQVRFTRAASSATCSHTHAVLHSTIRT
jgi:xylulose-5-phosphate/fructose-6-phosphate phosphoketolase